MKKGVFSFLISHLPIMMISFTIFGKFTLDLCLNRYFMHEIEVCVQYRWKEYLGAYDIFINMDWRYDDIIKIGPAVNYISLLPI